MNRMTLICVLAFMVAGATEMPALVRRARLNLELVERLQQSRGNAVSRAGMPDLEDPRARFHRGVGALEAGRAEDATALLRGYLHHDSHNELGAYFLGMAYRAEGKDEDALSVWRSAGLSRVFSAVGRRDGSPGALQTAIAIGDVDPTTFFMAGDLLWSEGRKEAAAEMYERGLSLEAEVRPDGWLAAARIAEQRGQPADALAHVRRYTLQRPEDTRGYLRSAALLDRMGEGMAAEEMFRDCADRTGAISCYVGASRMLRLGGDSGEAVKWAEEARARFPGSSEPLLALAEARWAEGDYERADLAYAEAAAFDSQNFWIPFWRGELAMRRGDLDSAIRWYGAALDLNSTSHGVYLALGKAYRARGDFEAAEAAIRKSLEISPGWPEAVSALHEAGVNEQ